MDKRAGVYIIKDLETGGEYIGSSKNIKNRIYKHFYKLKMGTHHNNYLQSVYNLKRPLVAGALFYCSANEMRDREQEEIKKRGPKYNLIKNVHSQSFGEKHPQSKIYKVINPEGEVVVIRGIVRFCEKNNMSHSALYQVLNGELYQYFGWRKFNKTEVGKKIIPRIYRNKPTLLSPSGDIFDVQTSISEFCKKYNLDYTTLCRVVNGEAYQHRGWRLYKVSEEGKEFTKPNSVYYELESPDGGIISGTARQLKKFGLSPQGLSNLVKERQETHKNYKLKDYYKVCQNR